MTKSIQVLSDDPANPNTRLTIKGPVKRFATIRPNRVSLVGPLGSKLRQTVSIMPEAEYPFTITSHRAGKGEFFEYKLIEKQEGQKRGYELVADNLKADKGWYSDTIILTTDSAVRPELRIRVNGNIKEIRPVNPALVSEDKPQPQVQ